jgi:hypothetical protein
MVIVHAMENFQKFYHAYGSAFHRHPESWLNLDQRCENNWLYDGYLNGFMTGECE